MLVKSQVIAILNDLLNQTARLRKGGNQAVYFCPVCKHYKRKLEICLEDGKDFGKWHCWTCNSAGLFLGSFLKKVNASQPYRDRLSKLTGDLRLLKRATKKSSNEQLSLPEEFISLVKPRSSIEYKNALAYLKRRGVLTEDILRYNIGYCEEGDYQYHIIVPSYDAMGRLNFFIGRRYYDAEGTIPYKKPEHPMDGIIGFESFINYSYPLNLCEGVFDAFAIRSNPVPLFGKYPSKKLREQMILNGVKEVNMILDNDAWRDAIVNYKLLLRQIPCLEKIRLVKLNGKDPSKLGFVKTHELIRTTPEFTESDWFRYELGL